MTNLQAVINVLASHREARRWADESVAIDILAQLGMDDAGDAVNAAPADEPVVAAEAAAEPVEHVEDHETVHGPDAPAHDDAARTADYKDQLDAALNPAP